MPMANETQYQGWRGLLVVEGPILGGYAITFSREQLMSVSADIELRGLAP